MSSLWLRGTVAPFITLLGLTSCRVGWQSGRETKGGPKWTFWGVKAPCSFGDKNPDSRARKWCHLDWSSSWEHRISCHPPGSQPACWAGKQAAFSSWIWGAPVFRAERSQRISNKRRRAGVVKHPLKTMESQRSLLANLPMCQSASRAQVQQALSRIDALLAAVWKCFAPGWGDVGTQWSRALK